MRFWLGVFHGNLVQRIYGFAMGLLLALVYETYGGLRASKWFHAMENPMSVLITNFMNVISAAVPFWAFTAVLLVLTIVMVNCIHKSVQRLIQRRIGEGKIFASNKAAIVINIMILKSRL